MNLPIPPIVIEGTRDALPKHGLLIEQRSPIPIHVRVLEPIPADAAASVEALRDLVRDQMIKGLVELRADLAD